MENKVELIINNLKKAIVGKEDALEAVVIGLLSGGHILIEDVPGVGKTTLAKALAKTLDLSYRRVQFTPDLMPSDILGISVFNRDLGSFEFKKGPIFTQIFLADEINRTSPKTQSSLLQAMEEGEISTEDVSFQLQKPFIVIATQNPLEYQGTFPLPEAQLDRFIMRISIGYPDVIYEREILNNHKIISNLDSLKPVANAEDIINMQKEVEMVKIHPELIEAIVNLANVTRAYEDLSLGASPRASLDLLKASKARAYIHQRNYVIPDDIKQMAYPVLAHRLIPSAEARIERKSLRDILNGALRRVYIPNVKND